MKKYFMFISLLLSLFSCRKDEINQIDGPNLFDIYGDFSIVSGLTVSQPNVDFSAGENVFFSCELTKIVDWEIKITGQTSGAKKIISGTSKILNQENSTWLGSTTNLPMFKAELCDVMLTFSGESDTLYTTITVDQQKTNSGFVVADFETGWNSGWSTFIQSGGNMDFSIKADSNSPEKDNYYNVQGTVNWDWLIGLVDFNASAYGASVLPLTDNGDNLYFNALVYGEAGLPNTLGLFRFDEDDNNDGSFNELTEDQFTYEFPVDWVGWKLISIKYTDLVGNGNGGNVYNPNKINKVSFLHLANPSSGFAKSGLDYLIFTENEPLIP